MALVGAIDAGGTSWRCAIIDTESPKQFLARTQFPTTLPNETLAKAVNFFKSYGADNASIQTLGVACFGPVAVNLTLSNWGYILATPKLGWANTNVAGVLGQALNCPVRIETDVIAAAQGERAWGAGRGFDHLAYVTVGTGIGAGILVDGAPIHGALHPEAGHMYAPRHPNDTQFKGVCTIHKDCIEGLASAPALKERWGIDGQAIPDDHPAWEIEAHYLAHLALNLILTCALNRVIFGGGVCQRSGLVERIDEQLRPLLGAYGVAAPGGSGISIVRAGLGADAGLLGACWLAAQT